MGPKIFTIEYYIRKSECKFTTLYENTQVKLLKTIIILIFYTLPYPAQFTLFSIKFANHYIIHHE